MNPLRLRRDKRLKHTDSNVCLSARMLDRCGRPSNYLECAGGRRTTPLWIDLKILSFTRRCQLAKRSKAPSLPAHSKSHSLYIRPPNILVHLQLHAHVQTTFADPVCQFLQID